MTFHVVVTGVDELADHQLLTDVQIDRRLYGHSSASASIRWPDTDGYPDRTAALLAGKVLNCPVEITWRDNDLGEATPCFRGYVEAASAERLPSSSVLHLTCASYTKRTDLVPRFRAFQATTLSEIASHIAAAEPLIKIISPGDLQIPIALSLQHGETDFAYLTRMLRAWGVPMATDDRAGRVLLGARGQEPPVPFPDADWGWSHITFAGALHALPSFAGGGAATGATGLVREALGGFLGQLSRRAADYFPQADGPALSQAHAETSAQTGTSGYQMHLAGAVLPFAPGHVGTIEDQQHHVAAISITGSPLVTTAHQTIHLQPGAKLQEKHTAPPVWSPRSLWAFVTANENDPWKQGRVQVEFEFEPLHPQPSHERAWLHTLTPYGGGQDPGFARLHATPRLARATSYGGGFLSLPEVGERVLVQFSVAWDDDAIIIGSVRHGPVIPAHNPRDTKRWRTPSGNEIALTTQGDGASAKDIVDLHAQGQPVFQAVVDHTGQSVSVQCAGSYVHLLNKGGEMRVEVFSGGAMLLHAAGHLQIEGESVQIKAKGGGAGIKIGGKTTGKAIQTGKKRTAHPAKGSFDCAMKFLKPQEGGYTNNPHDHGGATNLGVTHANYDDYRRSKGLEPRSIKEITPAEAKDYYYQTIWLPQHCDTMPPKLAIAHFDWSVNHYAKGSTQDLQGVLGVPKSGHFGSETAQALQEKLAEPNGEDRIVSSYLRAREDWYKQRVIKRPDQKVFEKGWLNRVHDIKRYLKDLDKNCPNSSKNKS